MKKETTFKILVIGIIIATVICLTSCHKPPQVIYQTQDRVVTSFDTITIKSTDTVPCNDFEGVFFNGIDTVYVEVEKQKLVVKTVVKRDTVFRTTTAQVITPQAKRQVTKIDNSTKIKKSTVGDGNTSKSGNTTKKSNWFWIFLAGMLTMFIGQNVVWRFAKIHLPFLNFIR